MPQASNAEITVKKFYRYFLTQNAPLHIIDGCADWPAMKSWQDREYLSQHFGTRLMQPMAISSETRYPAGKYTYDKFLFDIKDSHPTARPMNMR